MSMKINKVDEFLTEIEWQCNLKRLKGETTKGIIEESASNFNISCTYSLNYGREIEKDVFDVPFDIGLCLTSKESSKTSMNDGDSSVGEQSYLTADSYYQPSAIWASVNGGGKFSMKLRDSPGTGEKAKQAKTEKVWKSEKIRANLIIEFEKVRMTKIMAEVSIHLWIKFQPFTFGEMNVLTHMSKMFVEQSNCDVQFCFEKDQHIGAHISILAARSPVFAAMFQYEMRESKTGQVEIPDIEHNIFNKLLHYIYSGRNKVPLTEMTAQPLLLAADKYDIGDLKEECVRFLISIIRVDNAINLMVWAHLKLVDILERTAFGFIVENGKEICKQKNYEILMKNHPELCLRVTRDIVEQYE